MALNFPSSPTLGQTYTSGNTTWEWDGSRWVNISVTIQIVDAETLDSQNSSYYLDYNNFSNTPSIPSLTGYATETYVNTSISNLANSAPATLDTLNELAAALGDDPNFATTVTNSIASKLPLSGGTLTGQLTAQNLIIAEQGIASNSNIFFTDSFDPTRPNGIVFPNDTLPDPDFWAGIGGTGYDNRIVVKLPYTSDTNSIFEVRDSGDQYGNSKFSVGANESRFNTAVDIYANTYVTGSATFISSVHFNQTSAGEEFKITSASSTTFIVDGYTLDFKRTDGGDTYITNSGTGAIIVGGRDVAADGTKLDGIASGATAYTNSSVDAHLNTSAASSGQLLSWTGSDYDWTQAGAINDVFYENSATVSSDYTLTVGKNATSAGPITIAEGVTVTVPDGSRWAVV